jgi:hypothetical protein
MSQQNIGKPDVEALENAASIIQQEEQKLAGQNLPRGAGIYSFHFFFLFSGHGTLN